MKDYGCVTTPPGESKMRLEHVFNFSLLKILKIKELTPRELYNLVKLANRLFRSKATTEVYLHFLKNHPTQTAKEIEDALLLPESTVYRAINTLRELGVLIPIRKLQKPPLSLGGPRTIEWGLDLNRGLSTTPKEKDE